MFPLHDDIPPRTTPVVTYAMIAACSVVFIIQILAGNRGNQLVEQWGMVPARVVNSEEADARLVRHDFEVIRVNGVPAAREIVRPLERAAINDWLTLVTCIFLHGGWMHFLGNMWFLHIFGDNVEDRFGHTMYLLLYLAGGVLAGISQLLVDPSSTVPTIGASGAIAAVMGAYVMLYPSAVVETLIPLPILFTTFPVPAPVFLGVWFLLQIYNGVQIAGSEGVAWWAHIGGFAFGFLIALAMVAMHWASPPVPEEQRHRDGLLGL